MPELSTLLRQSLRAAEKPTLPHPDADALTAFAEELLPPAERDQVLKHLAVCRECRDVVALTMPDAVAAAEQEQEVVVPAAAPVRRKWWFLTPAFGLAGSIAAMIIGLTLILRLPQVTERETGNRAAVPQTAKQSSPALPATTPAAPPKAEDSAAAKSPVQAHAPTPLAAQAGRADVASGNAFTSAARKAPSRELDTRAKASDTPVIAADLRSSDYVNRTFLVNTYETQAPTYRDLPQAPLPAQSQLAFAPPAVVAGNTLQSSGPYAIRSAAGQSTSGMVTVYSGSGENKNPTLLSKMIDLGKHPLGKRGGAPIQSGSLSASAMFTPGSSSVQPSDAIAGNSTELSGGGLAQSSAFSSNALSFSRRSLLGASQFQWKIVEGKLLKSSDLAHWSEENPAGENVQFSVVSANGPEIWAGGKDAALMHSHDGGATWERVTLGAAATGTINSIEAAGVNLHVRSSSGQSWASQDGGKSWTLQD
jgi:Photosynthesis system II assembly factor YCF48/Putative zinc-finger